MKKKTHPLLKAEKKLDNYIWSTSAYLGSGPSGQIYKGIDVRTRTAVAIKIMQMEDFPSLFGLSAINEEIKLLKNIQNPLLVPIFDVFINKRRLYIIEEYCHQGDLRKCLSYNKGPLNESMILSLFKQIVSIIQALQSLDWSHCNLKPENIMIFSRKDEKSIKITDYYIPRLMKHAEIKITSGFGIYDSPQILTGSNYSNKSEIWSFGLILYEIVFGKLPWFGLNKKEYLDNIKEKSLMFPYRVEISQELKNILRGCLQYDENKRLSLKELIKHQDFLKEIIEKKLKFFDFDEKTSSVIKKLQFLVNQQNIQIEKLFQSQKTQEIMQKGEASSQNKLLYLKDFSLIISVLDPKMSIEEIELFYERLDPEKQGVSLEDFKEILTERDFSEFEAYEDPFLEEKTERVVYVLRETIRRRKIDVEKLFQIYDVSGNNELSFEEFERLLIAINPIISHEESNYLFQKLDYDKSGDIDLNEFKAYVLRDTKLEEKLKHLENMYHAIKKELRNLILTQKVKPEKIFEKFKRESTQNIGLEGISKFLKVLDVNLQEEEIEYIFERVSEGNDFLTKEEFLRGFID